jgi:hypothetical protein
MDSLWTQGQVDFVNSRPRSQYRSFYSLMHHIAKRQRDLVLSELAGLVAVSGCKGAPAAQLDTAS